jgi:hypothetical protein
MRTQDKTYYLAFGHVGERGDGTVTTTLPAVIEPEILDGEFAEVPPPAAARSSPRPIPTAT